MLNGIFLDMILLGFFVVDFRHDDDGISASLVFQRDKIQSHVCGLLKADFTLAVRFNRETFACRKFLADFR